MQIADGEDRPDDSSRSEHWEVTQTKPIVQQSPLWEAIQAGGAQRRKHVPLDLLEVIQTGSIDERQTMALTLDVIARAIQDMANRIRPKPMEDNNLSDTP